MKKRNQSMIAVAGILLLGGIGVIWADDICDSLAFQYYKDNIPETDWAAINDSGTNLHIEYRLHDGNLEAVVKELISGPYYDPSSPTPASVVIRWPGNKSKTYELKSGRADISIAADQLYDQSTCNVDFSVDVLNKDGKIIYPAHVEYGPITQ